MSVVRSIIFFIFVSALPTYATLENDLTYRIQAYVRAEIATTNNVRCANPQVVNSENLIHQMEQQLSTMEVAMNKWQEMEDSHFNLKIANFKSSLIEACCNKQTPQSSGAGGQQQERKHNGGGGRRGK